VVRVARKKRTTALFDPIKAAACITDRVLVGVSGGKDSAVTLELCSRFFPRIAVFFMYIVPGLSFQEKILRYYERKYKISIIRIPHFMLSEFFRYGTFRQIDDRIPIVSTLDAYNYVREMAKTWWIAGGERISDSIIRRAMIKSSSAIDQSRGRFYPVAYWNKQDVVDYIRLYKLKVGEESQELGFSFRSLMPQEIIKIKRRYPEDYERIRYFFPLIEATIGHYEYNPDFYLDKGALLNGEQKNDVANGNQ
jgi:phosphoadenosine phosphosulfate reductase